MNLVYVCTLIIVVVIHMHANSSYKMKTLEYKEATLLPLARFLQATLKDCGVDAVKSLVMPHIWILVLDKDRHIVADTSHADEQCLLSEVLEKLPTAPETILHNMVLQKGRLDPLPYTIAVTVREDFVVLCGSHA